MDHWKNHWDFRALVGMGAAGSEAVNIGRSRADRAHLQDKELGFHFRCCGRSGEVLIRT